MTAKEEASVDELIRIEWALMADLRKMLSDQTLSKSEKIRVANAIAYHSIALNKLLSQKGQQEAFDEESLGNYVQNCNQTYKYRRIAHTVRRDFRDWKRRLSLNK